MRYMVVLLVLCVCSSAFCAVPEYMIVDWQWSYITNMYFDIATKMYEITGNMEFVATSVIDLTNTINDFGFKLVFLLSVLCISNTLMLGGLLWFIVIQAKNEKRFW